MSILLTVMLYNFYVQFKFQDALLQHTRRAVYQAGIWTSSDSALLNVPSPLEFSWMKREDNQWQPVWMTIPKVSSVCRELIKCTCKGRCLRCKCAKEKLNCTPLCKCGCPENKYQYLSAARMRSICQNWHAYPVNITKY